MTFDYDKLSEWPKMWRMCKRLSWHCHTVIWNEWVNIVVWSHVMHCSKICAQAAESNDQKEHCVAVCSERKEQTKNDPSFISTIVSFTDTAPRRWSSSHLSGRPKKYDECQIMSYQLFVLWH
jgi:hypothetical protein